MNSSNRAPWPHLRSYVGASLDKISMPVGGIGTGSIGFGGRGELTDWEVRNKPAKGARPEWGFLALACRSADSTVVRVLEGELGPGGYEGSLGSPGPVAGLPRFRACRFDAAYPLATATLEDDGVPARVTVSAFNPFIPGNEEASAFPAMVLRVEVANLTSEPLDVRLLVSSQVPPNPLQPYSVGGAQSGRNVTLSGETFGKTPAVGVQIFRGPVGIQLTDSISPDVRDHGTISVAMDGGDDAYACRPVEPGQWNTGVIMLWRALERWGDLQRAEDGTQCSPEAAVPIVAEAHVGPLASRTLTVFITWHYPSRKAWAFTGPGARGGDRPEIVGNEYANRFSDARDVVDRLAPCLDDLERRTTRFVRAVVNTSLPEAVREAALFNLSTLRSQTFFRTADGSPYGWEGCLDDEGSCPGSCTHVWNYDLATPFLFPSIARAMRRVELVDGMMDNGALAFRILQPHSHSTDWGIAAADGQFGSLVKLFREWRQSGDDEIVVKLWPYARRALEFAWLPGSWDADEDGVAEGCQHYSMDVELYGPNPIVQGWYIAALRACAAMAAAVGEDVFAEKCRQMSERGRRWTEENLFNGEYYMHQVRPPGTFEGLLPEVRHPSMGATDAANPEYQIGDGCQIDQLVGHVASVFAGLGEVFDSNHVLRSLESVQAYNYVTRARGRSSLFRTFMLNDESGYITVSYPHGDEPRAPMPYTSQVMSGLEYTLGVAAALAGRPALAEHVARVVRGRHNGFQRNPFNEAECGDHYARALASWGLIPALTGFAYDGCDGVMTVARSDVDVDWIWCAAGAWGVVRQRNFGPENVVSVQVEEGTIAVHRLVLSGVDVASQVGGGTLAEGDRVVVTCHS